LEAQVQELQDKLATLKARVQELEDILSLRRSET
jgi:cell division protein FtsB